MIPATLTISYRDHLSGINWVSFRVNVPNSSWFVWISLATIAWSESGQPGESTFHHMVRAQQSRLYLLSDQLFHLVSGTITHMPERPDALHWAMNAQIQASLSHEATVSLITLPSYRMSPILVLAVAGSFFPGYISLSLHIGLNFGTHRGPEI